MIQPAFAPTAEDDLGFGRLAGPGLGMNGGVSAGDADAIA
jgi:hypothetical protein